MNHSKSVKKTKNIVLLALFTAIVILFQLLGMIPQISVTKMSFVLIPIVLGGCILGVGAGTWLGFVFSLIVFLSGLFGADAFTATLIQINPIYAVIIVFGKGVAAGFVPAIIFKALHHISFSLSVILASILAPIVNTGLYCIILFTLFRPLVESYGLQSNASFFLGVSFIFTLILSNFLIEFAINVIITPIICHVLKKSWRLKIFNN